MLPTNKQTNKNRHRGQHTKCINTCHAFSTPECRRAASLDLSVLAANVIHRGYKWYIGWSLRRCPALAVTETREHILPVDLKVRTPCKTLHVALNSENSKESVLLLCEWSLTKAGGLASG